MEGSVLSFLKAEWKASDWAFSFYLENFLAIDLNWSELWYGKDGIQLRKMSH
jgi:hypothetical protein